MMVYSDPDFPIPDSVPDPTNLNLKAEALMRRQREKQEEEVRAATREKIATGVESYAAEIGRATGGHGPASGRIRVLRLAAELIRAGEFG